MLRKYGVEAVGLWWITCELVAKDSPNFWIKKEKDWKITLQDVSRMEIKKMEEILNFFAEINAIDKLSLNVGDLRIKQMKEYGDDYTKRSKRVRTLSELTPNNVRQHNTTLHNNTSGKKPYYKNQLMIKDYGKWYVLEKSGKVLFTGNEKEIIYK